MKTKNEQARGPPNALDRFDYDCMANLNAMEVNT